MRLIFCLLIIVLTLIDHLASQGIPEYITAQKTPWAQSNSNKRLGCRSVLPKPYFYIDCICSFLEDQINMHSTPEYALAQTFRVGWDYVIPQEASTLGILASYELSMRSDVYDNALAAILLMNSGQMEGAQRICDTLVLLVNLDNVGDGRTRSSYYHTNPILRDYDGINPVTYGTHVLNGDVLTGNMAFQIIALGRWYHHTKDFKYLQAAIKIANFINTNLRYDSPWGGFYAGYQYNSTTTVFTPLFMRSIEHNIDIFAAARLLYGLTGDDKWKDMTAHAQKFVTAMYHDTGYYYIGAPNALNSDTWVTSYPTCDGQTWNALAEVDDDIDKKTKSLNWVLNNLQLTEYQLDPLTGETIQYDGVIFSTGGTGIQSEQTAAAAMAFYTHGQRIASSDPTSSKAFLEAAEKLLQTLLNMQKHAMRSDGHGIVAAVNPGGAKVWPGDETNGESWRYLPILHTASSAWTGLALHFIKNNDIYANPFADYSKKKVTKYLSTGVLQGQAVAAPVSEQPQPLGQTYTFGVVTLVISVVIGGVVLAALTVLAILNVRLYRKNKEIEYMDRGTTQEMAAFNLPGTPGSTSTPGTPIPSHSPVIQ